MGRPDASDMYGYTDGSDFFVYITIVGGVYLLNWLWKHGYIQTGFHWLMMGFGVLVIGYIILVTFGILKYLIFG